MGSSAAAQRAHNACTPSRAGRASPFSRIVVAFASACACHMASEFSRTRAALDAMLRDGDAVSWPAVRALETTVAKLAARAAAPAETRVYGAAMCEKIGVLVREFNEVRRRLRRAAARPPARTTGPRVSRLFSRPRCHAGAFRPALAPALPPAPHCCFAGAV